MKNILILLFLILSLGFAQERAIYHLDTIIVKGSFYESISKTIVGTLYTISNEWLNSKPKTTAFSLLNVEIPSLFVTERTNYGYGISTGSAGRISIRGLSGNNQVLTLINGVPDYQGLFGHYIGDVYSSGDMEEIEVINGPASVIYGSGAMGGVIKLNSSLKDFSGNRAIGEIEYGSFNSIKTKVGGEFGSSLLYSKINLNYNSTDGHRPSSASKIRGGNFDLRYEINKNFNFGLNSYLYFAKSYNPGTIFKPSANDSMWTDITRFNINLSIQNKFENSDGELKLFFNNGIHHIFDGFASNDRILGVILLQSIKLLNSLNLMFGLDAKNFGGKAENQKFSKLLIDTTINEYGSFLLTNFNFNNFSFSAGARINYHSVYKTEFVPQFLADYVAFEKFKIHLGVGKGFRNPNISEIFMFTSQPFVNLKPEEVWNYEIGINHQILNDKIQYSLTSYLMETRNLIIRTGVAPNTKWENVRSTRNRGLELKTQIEIYEGLFVNSSLSYINMDTKYVGTPEFQSLLELIYHFYDFSIDLNFRTVEKLYTSLTPEKQQSYSLLNSIFSYKVNDYLKLFLTYENILNREYEIIYGYPMPKASIYFGLKTNLN